MENEFNEKNDQIFLCINCDFKCSFMSDWKRHLSTRKHLVSVNGNKMEQNGNEFAEKNESQNNYTCKNCNANYKSSSGLWKHNKKCVVKNVENNVENNIVYKENKELKIKDINFTDENNKEFIIMLIKQNSELIKENSDFKNMMMDVIKNGTNNVINTNSNNKAFNLNLFLNETCKDAMNIMDFVESIKLQLSDLERVGEVGYIEGITNIIVKNLKELDVSQRPVHCTDKKRETIYIKDEDKWEKDNENKKMHKVIKKVAAKNARLILKYKEAHPDCNTYHSKYSDQYNKIIVEAMGGSGDNDLEKEEKIIKNISKTIVVDK